MDLSTVQSLCSHLLEENFDVKILDALFSILRESVSEEAVKEALISLQPYFLLFSRSRKIPVVQNSAHEDNKSSDEQLKTHTAMFAEYCNSLLALIKRGQDISAPLQVSRISECYFVLYCWTFFYFSVNSCCRDLLLTL